MCKQLRLPSLIFRMASVIYTIQTQSHMVKAYLDHQSDTVCVCSWPVVLRRVLEPRPRIESGKLEGEQGGDIAGVSGEHELKCAHDSLKHRWSVGDMGP